MSEKASWAEAREVLHKVIAEDGPGAMFMLANALDAAEERGRRAGFSEGKEAAATEHIISCRCENYDGILKRIRALAPRDSGKED